MGTIAAEIVRNGSERVDGEPRMRGAIALFVVNDLASEALGRAAGDLLGSPPAWGVEPDRSADSIRRVGDIVDGVEREWLVWRTVRKRLGMHAGVRDGASTELSDEVLRLAGVPEELIPSGIAAYASICDERSVATVDPAWERFSSCVLTEPPLQPASIGAGIEPAGAGAVSTDSGDATFAGVRKFVEVRTDSHIDERLHALQSQMDELRLADGDTRAQRRYARLALELDHRLTAIDDDLRQSAQRALETERHALQEAVTAPAQPAPAAQDELRRLAVAHREATAKHIAQLRAVLINHKPRPANELSAADAAPALERLAAAESALARCSEHLEADDPVAALLSLAETPLPVAESWRRSADYRAACEATVVGMRDLADHYRAELAVWMDGALTRLAQGRVRLGETIAAAVDHCVEERESAWIELQRAADTCRRETSRSLAKSAGALGGDLLVRGAATLGRMDDLVTATLGAAAPHMLPGGRLPIDSPKPRDHLATAMELISELAENWSAWSGLCELSPAGNPLLSGSRCDNAATLGLSGISGDLAPTVAVIERYLDGTGDRVEAQRAIASLTQHLDARLEALRSDEPESSPTPSLAHRSAARSVAADDDRYLDRTRSLVDELAHPLDPHKEDRRGLNSHMTELGLLAAATTLPGRVEYEAAWNGYDDGLLNAVRAFSTSMQSELDAQRGGLSAVGAPPGLERFGGERLVGLVVGVRDATRRYLELSHTLLAAPPDQPSHGQPGKLLQHVRERLMAVERDLVRCDERIADGEPMAALLALTNTPLPLAMSWEPSRVQQAVLEGAADDLRAMVDRYRHQVGEWVRTAVDRLDRATTQISETVGAAAEVCARKRDAIWANLNTTAHALEHEATQLIIDADGQQNAGLAVRGAVALCAVDDLVATRLEGAAGGMLPEIRKPRKSTTIDHHLKPLEAAFQDLERSSVAWATTNALLMQVVEPGANTADAWANTLLPLAGIPTHVASAGKDVFSYLHKSLPTDLGHSAHVFVDELIQNAPLLSVINSHDGLAQNAINLIVAGPQTLEGQWLLNPDNAAAASVHFAEAQLKQALEYLGQSAIHSQQIQDAIGQVGQGAHLAGEAAMNILGHVPIVTLVISSAREIRARRDHDIEIADSVKNVAIDVGAVAAGLAAGSAAAAAIPVPHAWFFTVPGAAAGAIAGRAFKIQRFKKAQANYESAHGRYEARLMDLVGELTTTAGSKIESERESLSERVGAPERLELSGKRRLRKLVTDLRGATEHYLELSGTLLDAASNDGNAGVCDQSAVAAIRERMSAAKEGVARCDRHIEVGELMPALMSLTDVALPVCDSWAPALQYQTACDLTAGGVNKLADRHRQGISEWLDRAVDEFDRSKKRITSAVTAAKKAFDREHDDAAAPVAEALKAFEVAHAALA